ncbi:MAG: 50S ribosomal protein L15 [Bacteroidetes bacterium]|nr:MAG: 50S ribosomal protein L15 [Bacteroidota bacterium]
MKLHDLKPAKGAVKRDRRLGRGQGSGKGGTATRGHKGDKSRSGFKNKRNFEGGQMPLQMRLPKRGFHSRNRVEYVPLNLERLQAIADKYQVTTIDPEMLKKLGIIGKNDRVKVLARGELNVALQVTAHAASESAKKAIEEKGGTVTIL